MQVLHTAGLLQVSEIKDKQHNFLLEDTGEGHFFLICFIPVVYLQLCTATKQSEIFLFRFSETME